MEQFVNIDTVVSNPEPTLAWIWFLLPLLGLLFVVGIIIMTDTTEVKGKTLAVLGMTEAGKTLFYRILQNRPYTRYDGTGTDDYASFAFKHRDRVILIEKGRDIGGGEHYVKQYYKDMIESKDIVFFFFNVYKYLNDSQYAMEVRIRLDWVWNCLKNKYGSEKSIKERLATIGSHLDLFDKSRQKELLNELQSTVGGKTYAPMFHNNFILANLTKRDEFLNKLLESKIFG